MCKGWGTKVFMDVGVMNAVSRLTASVQKFDKSSAELVEATNKLTTRILWLTVVVLLVGAIQTIFTVLAYYKK